LCCTVFVLQSVSCRAVFVLRSVRAAQRSCCKAAERFVPHSVRAAKRSCCKAFVPHSVRAAKRFVPHSVRAAKRSCCTVFAPRSVRAAQRCTFCIMAAVGSPRTMPLDLELPTRPTVTQLDALIDKRNQCLGQSVFISLQERSRNQAPLWQSVSDGQ
jgi:hypothetical protein